MPDEAPDDRESGVGLQFTVGVELKRRRGQITDVWEARITSMAIALLAGLVILYALVQVFVILEGLFRGSS